MANQCMARAASAIRLKRRRRLKSFAATLLWGVSLLVFCAVFVRADKSSRESEESMSKLSYLIARRELADPFFEKSVVLMLPSEGMPLVVGLIVNKPTKVTLTRLYPESPVLKDSTATAYFGGPVDFESPTLVFHSAKPPHYALSLFRDVYLTFDPDVISTLLNDPKQKGDFRLILGRAQWGPEQLQNEMREGSWYKLEAEGDVIFDSDSEHLWRRLHDRAQPRLDIRNLLTEPRLPTAM
jgi:putative transcriptional regulator